MNATPPEPFNAEPRLRWSFWIMLLTPAITAVVLGAFVASQTTGMGTIGPLLLVNMFCGVVLNLICSVVAGNQYARYRNPEFHSTRKMFGWALLFFVFNLFLLPAGYALVGAAAKHLAKWRDL